MLTPEAEEQVLITFQDLGIDTYLQKRYNPRFPLVKARISLLDYTILQEGQKDQLLSLWAQLRASAARELAQLVIGKSSSLFLLALTSTGGQTSTPLDLEAMDAVFWKIQSILDTTRPRYTFPAGAELTQDITRT